WRRDLRRQGAHGMLDVAAGPDVLGDTAGALGEPLEHVRVDVIPDTERKDPKRATAAVCLVGDALGIGLTHRRHPVGQEDHDAERAFGGGRRECLRQRPGDVRAALGRDRPDPLLRVADVQQWVRTISAEGGTNIAGALAEAFATSPAEGALGVVVFLTDGMPTVGETDPERIADQADRGRGAFRVFAFGVGYDVNTYVLERLTERARGVAEYIRPGGDIEQAVGALAAKISSPVL